MAMLNAILLDAHQSTTDWASKSNLEGFLHGQDTLQNHSARTLQNLHLYSPRIWYSKLSFHQYYLHTTWRL